MGAPKFTFYSLGQGGIPARHRKIPRHALLSYDSPAPDPADEAKYDSLIKHDLPVTCNTCGEPWCSILIINRNGRAPPNKFSVVGDYGHVEKAAVFAHLFGTALYALVYAPIRQACTPMGASTSTSARLGLAAIFGNALCLFLSSLYHVYSSTAWAPFIRPLDYLGIYTSAALTTLGEVGIISSPSGGVAWQSYADPLLAAAFLWTFFAIRRFIVRASGDHVYYTPDDGCVFGFARRVYVDGAHSCLRACGSTLLVFSWIYVLAAPSPHISDADKRIFYGTRGIGTLLLTIGMAIDNVWARPDVLQDENFAKFCSMRDQPCGCAGVEYFGGCVANAHFWWHVVSLVAMIIGTAGTEWLIGSYPELRE